MLRNEILGRYRIGDDNTLVTDHFLLVNSKALAHSMLGLSGNEVEVFYGSYIGGPTSIFKSAYVVSTHSIESGKPLSWSSVDPLVILYNRSTISEAVNNICLRVDKKGGTYGEKALKSVVYLWMEVVRVFRYIALLQKIVDEKECVPADALVELKCEHILQEQIESWRANKMTETQLKLLIDTSFVSAYAGHVVGTKNKKEEELSFDHLCSIIKDTKRSSWKGLISQNL